MYEFPIVDYVGIDVWIGCQRKALQWKFRSCPTKSIFSRGPLWIGHWCCMFFIWDWGLVTRFCIWLESLMYPTFEFWFWTCDCSYNGMLKTRHKTIQNTTSWINYEQLNKPIHFFGVGGNHMYFVVIIAKLQAYDCKRKEKENANLNVKNIEFKSTNLNWHPKHQKKKKRRETQSGHTKSNFLPFTL